jgi:hypothetical protein
MATDRSTVEGVNSLGNNLDNMLKEQYLSKGLQDVRPDFTVLMSTVPFVGGSEKAGSELVWPVVTSREHGFTALGNLGANLALNDATKARTAQAKVSSYPFMGRTQIDNVSISRAKQGPQAFVNALEYKISNLQDSFVILNEQELLYGQSGLGTVESITGTLTTVAQTGTIVIKEQEFADHVWIGSEDMIIELGSALAVTVGRSVLQITGYDIDARSISVVVVAAGTAPVANDLIHRRGFAGNVGPGLQTLFSQTSGTLLNVIQSANPLWRVNQYNCAAALTPTVPAALSFEKVADAVAKAVGRGLAEKLTLHVHPRVFASMMPDFNTIKTGASNFKSRIFTTSSEVKKLEHGVYGITFIVGSVEVVLVANPFIKVGHAFGVADGELMRCGSSDITYKIPGEEQEKYFHRLPDIAGLELRVFSDQALFSMTLNKHLHIYNIAP